MNHNKNSFFQESESQNIVSKMAIIVFNALTNRAHFYNVRSLWNYADLSPVLTWQVWSETRQLDTTISMVNHFAWNLCGIWLNTSIVRQGISLADLRRVPGDWRARGWRAWRVKDGRLTPRMKDCASFWREDLVSPGIQPLRIVKT